MTIKNPKSVLFVCNQNAIRSPMAKALLDKYSSRRIFAESVGLTAGFADLFAAEAVSEVGGSKLDTHNPKTLDQIDPEKFDLIIALTPAAHQRLTSCLSDKAERVEYWETPDPGDAEGTRDQIMDSYRLVRDHLEVRIADRFTFD